MFNLYGKKPRCLWCRKADKENYKEIEMNIKYARPPQEKAIVCSDECEKKVLDTCKIIETRHYLFSGFILSGIMMGIAGGFLAFMNLKFLLVSVIGMMCVGITCFVFPFVTPQTVKILGMKKGMILGRVSGIILLLVAMVMEFILIQSTKYW